MCDTNGLLKNRCKKRHMSGFHISVLVNGPKLLEFFMQFLSDVSKKSKSIVTFVIYASDSSYQTLIENAIFHYALGYSFGCTNKKCQTISDGYLQYCEKESLILAVKGT